MVFTVDPAGLVALLSSSSVDLIDVRGQAEWDTGYIEGSRLVPLEQLRADPDAHLVRGSVIVFICAKGIRSLQAAKLAERFGHQRVYSLDGGTKQWTRDGLSLTVDASAAAA